MFFEVFGNQATVTVVRFFLATKQAAAVQNLARNSFDMPRPHQAQELLLV